MRARLSKSGSSCYSTRGSCCTEDDRRRSIGLPRFSARGACCTEDGQRGSVGPTRPRTGSKSVTIGGWTTMADNNNSPDPPSRKPDHEVEQSGESEDPSFTFPSPCAGAGTISAPSRPFTAVLAQPPATAAPPQPSESIDELLARRGLGTPSCASTPQQPRDSPLQSPARSAPPSTAPHMTPVNFGGVIIEFNEAMMKIMAAEDEHRERQRHAQEELLQRLSPRLASLYESHPQHHSSIISAPHALSHAQQTSETESRGGVSSRDPPLRLRSSDESLMA